MTTDKLFFVFSLETSDLNIITNLSNKDKKIAEGWLFNPFLFTTR